MLSEFVKSADWKTEKHVPAIECAERVKAGDPLAVTVSVGREIAHPNTTAHHIVWIALHVVPDGAKASVELARCEFSAHGAGVGGADTGAAATCGAVTVTVKLAVSGTLYATAYCNIHGLWASEKTVAVTA
jgi:superoxide reductase